MLLPTQAEIASNPGDLLITEVQITGGTGLANNDYVKIYNNSNNTIDLTNYKLINIKNSSSTQNSIIAWSSADTNTLTTGQFHTWATSSNDFATTINADSSRSASLANTVCSIAIIKKDDDTIVDAFSWNDCGNGLGTNTTISTENCDNSNPIKFKRITGTNNFEVICINSTPATVDEEDNTTETIDQTTQQATTPIQAGGNTTSNNTVFSDEPYNNTSNIKTNSKEDKDEITDIDDTDAVEQAETKNQPTILISEFLPNPLGTDDPDNCTDCGEFIELTNYGSEAINLSGWQIQVDDRPSYTFPYYNLKSKSRLVLYRTQSNLILQNNQGKIIFKNQKNETIQTINYKDTTPNYAYALIESSAQLNPDWVWSKTLSPGEENYWIVPKNKPPVADFLLPDSVDIKTKIALDASDSYDPEERPLTYAWAFGDGQISSEQSPTHLFQKTGTLTVQLSISDGEDKTIVSKKIKITGDNPNIKTDKKILTEKPSIKSTTKTSSANNFVATGSIAKVKTLSAGTKTTVIGTVVVPPDIFGSQYLQIVDLTGGMQVYSNKKDFPDLYIGDQIEASGEISIVSGEYRLKTASQNDIKLLSQKHPPASQPIISTDLNQALLGSLVNVTGTILESKNDLVYLADKVDEITIQLKENSGLKNSDFVVGDEIKIIGIVKASGDEVRIWPRESTDLEIINHPQVLGEKINEQTNQLNSLNTTNQATSSLIIPAKDKSLEIYQYLLAFTAGVIAVLIIWIVRLKK
jgi:hypothetical protein